MFVSRVTIQTYWKLYVLYFFCHSPAPFFFVASCLRASIPHFSSLCFSRALFVSLIALSNLFKREGWTKDKIPALAAERNLICLCGRRDGRRKNNRGIPLRRPPARFLRSANCATGYYSSTIVIEIIRILPRRRGGGLAHRARQTRR